MPRCYMVKKSRTRHQSPSPCSPTEGSVAPPCYELDEDSSYTETRKAEYAELASLPLSERTAAETEAAHELLSLAHSLPPLPPLPALQPAPQLSVYTYTVQPNNVYIVADNSPRPIYQTIPAVDSCPCDQPNEQHYGYITYQPVPPVSVFAHPDPGSETDSDPEPQLEIASDAEPEPEAEPKTQPELESEPEVELESCSEPDQRSQDHSESQLRPLYYTESVSSPLRYDEPEPRSLDCTEDDSRSLHYSEVEPRPHFYLESESSSMHYSEPRALRYPETEGLSPLKPDLEYDPKRDEAVLTCDIKKETFKPHSWWPKKKYVCSECGKRYATSSNLSRHKQTHRSLDSMLAKRCGECGKVYVSMPALAMHVLTHKMGHTCGICGKQFSRPWLLRGHLRSHTGEKPYKCESCGKAFADRSNLRAHHQTHSSSKKYVCQYCSKTFALKSYLNKHQETACVRPEDK